MDAYADFSGRLVISSQFYLRQSQKTFESVRFNYIVLHVMAKLVIAWLKTYLE